MGSMLRMPIKTDRVTKEKTTLQYPWMLIEMKINEPFPDHIDFINDWAVFVRQDVKYEWQPIKCAHCQMLGHEEVVCRRKTTNRKEWRVINRDSKEGKENKERSP